MISRWAEAWTGARTPGAFKAIALGSWRAGDHLDVVFNLERMAPADLLRRTGARPGGYGYVGVTFRY